MQTYFTDIFIYTLYSSKGLMYMFGNIIKDHT